jgi:hypothetical protein
VIVLNWKLLCSPQLEELLGRGATASHRSLHGLTTSTFFRPNVEIVPD